MGRQTFNWWRRNRKRKTLKKSSPLIDRIKNGDFEVSQYLAEADYEISIKQEIIERETERGERLGLHSETIKQNIFNESDQYQRRYNRLMKDFYEDEDRILLEFRKAINKNFLNSFEYIFDRWLEDKEPDMTVEELYHRCNQIKKDGKWLYQSVFGRRAAIKPRSRKRRRRYD